MFIYLLFDLFLIIIIIFRGKPRNDNLDPYATFPIHQGRGTKDVFGDAVQRTQ